jgi:hypothetical protein
MEWVIPAGHLASSQLSAEGIDGSGDGMGRDVLTLRKEDQQLDDLSARHVEKSLRFVFWYSARGHFKSLPAIAAHPGRPTSATACRYSRCFVVLVVVVLIGWLGLRNGLQQPFPKQAPAGLSHLERQGARR